MSKRAFPLAATALSLTLAASAAMAFPTTFTVYINNNTFNQNNPATVPPTTLPVEPTITVGDTVTWVRVNGNHTTTAAAGQTETWGGDVGAATPYSHTFTHTGNFNYYCTHHGADIGGGQVTGMSAAVHVLPPPPCSTADVGIQGGVAGQDRLLNNNDFIVFINQFFNANAAADVGKQGGIAGPDGLFDNNDFVVFINRFFTDAPLCTG